MTDEEKGAALKEKWEGMTDEEKSAALNEKWEGITEKWRGMTDDEKKAAIKEKVGGMTGKDEATAAKEELLKTEQQSRMAEFKEVIDKKRAEWAAKRKARMAEEK